MSPWLILFLTLLGGGLVLAAVFYWTARRRDLVRRPVAKAGHTVTLNYPSPVLGYDPQSYDLLIFGGSVYMGEVGRPLKDYLSSLRFHGKQVLLFVVGDLEQSPELAGLRLCVPEGNQIRSIKIRPGEEKKLCQFALG